MEMEVEVKGRIARRGQPLKFYCETPVPMNLHGNSPSRRDVHLARELTRLRLMSAEDGERNLVEGAVERVAPAIDPPKFTVHIGYDRVRREYIKVECWMPFHVDIVPNNKLHRPRRNCNSFCRNHGDS